MTLMDMRRVWCRSCHVVFMALAVVSATAILLGVVRWPSDPVGVDGGKIPAVATVEKERACDPACPGGGAGRCSARVFLQEDGLLAPLPVATRRWTVVGPGPPFSPLHWRTHSAAQGTPWPRFVPSVPGEATPLDGCGAMYCLLRRSLCVLAHPHDGTRTELRTASLESQLIAALLNRQVLGGAVPEQVARAIVLAFGVLVDGRGGCGECLVGPREWHAVGEWARNVLLLFNTGRFPSATPTPSATASTSPSRSATPTASRSPSPSVTRSVSPTASRSASPSATHSASPTASPSASPTVADSASPTVSISASPTVSNSASPTASFSSTPTRSPSITPTPSSPASPSASPTPSVSPTPTQFPSATPTCIPCGAFCGALPCCAPCVPHQLGELCFCQLPQSAPSQTMDRISPWKCHNANGGK